MAFMLSPLLKRYTRNSARLYYARIFIALCGTTAFPWWLGDVKLTIPLTLGMVAAALTDLDDRLAGRLRNLIITLFCFYRLGLSRIAVSTATAICDWLNALYQRLHFARRSGSTLCNNCLRCIADRHLHYVGNITV